MLVSSTQHVPVITSRKSCGCMSSQVRDLGTYSGRGLCVQLHPLLTEDRACKHEVDYRSACLVKDGAREKKKKRSFWLSGCNFQLSHYWRDCGLATCQAPNTLIEPLTRKVQYLTFLHLSWYCIFIVQAKPPYISGFSFLQVQLFWHSKFFMHPCYTDNVVSIYWVGSHL